MRLTHHPRSTRSFIILIILVLTTVYTALVLTKIQLVKLAIPESNQQAFLPSEQAIAQTTNWTPYRDSNFPLSILVPEKWFVTTGTIDYGLYTINISPQANQHGIKIFISPEQFIGTQNLQGEKISFNPNYTVTNFQNIIYTTKIGNYYYTFDTSFNPALAEELNNLVKLARFE